MVNEHFKLKYWTVNHTPVIYVTFSFSRQFFKNAAGYLFGAKPSSKPVLGYCQLGQ